MVDLRFVLRWVRFLCQLILIVAGIQWLFMPRLVQPPHMSFPVSDVSIDKSTPAYLASMSIREPDIGQSFQQDVFENGDATPAAEQVLEVPALADPIFVEALKEETPEETIIRRSLPEVAIDVESQPVRILEDAEILVASNEMEYEEVDHTWISNLNDRLQKRLLVADRVYGILDRDWSVPPIIENRMQEILAEAPPKSDYRKEIPTQDGETIVIEDPSGTGKVNIETPQPVVVAGFNAPVEGHQITYERFRGNERQESFNGSAAQQTVRFPVEEESGWLLATATDRWGRPQYQARQTIVESQYSPLEFTPVSNGLNLEFVSAYSTSAQKIRVKDVDVEWKAMGERQKSENGTLNIPYVDSFSSSIVHATKEGYWPVIANVQNLKNQQIRLYPEKMVDALLSIVFADFEDSEKSDLSLIWGQIHGNATGSKVKIANAPDAKPIYFNEAFIPDTKLESATQNGWFVFVGAGEGSFLIDVENENSGFAQQMVVVKEGYLSSVDIQESYLQNVLLQPKNLGSEQTEIELFNVPLQEEKVIADWSEPIQVQSPRDTNFNVFEFYSEDPLSVRVISDGRQSVLPFATVDVETLQEWLDMSELELDVEKGFVLISHNEAIEEFVAFENGEIYDRELIYLNEDGDLVDRPDEKGYILIPNVDPGTVEYFLFRENSDRVFSGISTVDPMILSTHSVIFDESP